MTPESPESTPDPDPVAARAAWLSVLAVTIALIGGLGWLLLSMPDPGAGAGLGSQVPEALRAQVEATQAADVVGLREDAAALERGAATWRSYCVACHEADGSGRVGPNLTDRWWIHGPDPLSIYRTVALGVPERGMVPWIGSLGDARVREVSAYLLTLKDTNRPGKAPEGVDAAGDPPPEPPR